MGESEGSRRVAPVFVRRIDDAYLMVVKCISLLGSEFCCSACSAITSSPVVASDGGCTNSKLDQLSHWRTFVASRHQRIFVTPRV